MVIQTVLAAAMLCCIILRNCVINFTIFLRIIFMDMLYCIMKGIQQFAANLLSYIPSKYY